MLLRNATENDVESLFEVRCSVVENHQSRDELRALGITPESVREMIMGGDYVSIIAECDLQLVGFTMAQISEGYVFACFIRPEYERRGIGKQLMKATEEGLRKAGVKNAWLSTGPGEDLRAVGFYSHLGWKRNGFLDDGQIRFEKDLVST